ncbi:uncharacterized protein LOC126695974 [Quercus robur]|uniref:uncharacterized protein LOC126695974 n=1 Tax=Quercus robur TaxID=38942 RepID=UPI0021619060|nr:uncharacterized protein LOC126695974 [Quercus robur]
MASPSSSDSKSGEDSNYRTQSRTPSCESFSYKEERYHKQRSKSPTHRSLGNDAMSRALCQISKSPFTRRIDKVKLPRRFAQPTFTVYNGRTDPIEHVSHFNQRITVHSRNEALMCKVFPSNLGLVAMRWFDGLDEGSIGSYQELTKVFKAWYWETFNEIDGDLEDVAIRMFKVSLPIEHELRKSLTKKLVQSMRQLMDRIDKYKQVEDDQPQGKGKAKVAPPDQRDFRSNNNRPRRDFIGHIGLPAAQVVIITFKEPVHQILEKIKVEPYFKWPNKMGGDPTRQN